ncbi:MAG: ribonuclease P protein component [Bacteroidota bacterium]|nr:ribonuclease P protein component [Bacteroidota bacterium]
MKKNRFNKVDRLKGQKNISRLFSDGKYFYGTSMNVVVKLSDKKHTAIKIGITVPKRKLKTAVKRNLLKRRIKEIVRVKKNELLPYLKESDSALEIFFIWNSFGIKKSKQIKKEIELLFLKISFFIEQKQEN